MRASSTGIVGGGRIGWWRWAVRFVFAAGARMAIERGTRTSRGLLFGRNNRLVADEFGGLIVE